MEKAPPPLAVEQYTDGSSYAGETGWMESSTPGTEATQQAKEEDERLRTEEEDQMRSPSPPPPALPLPLALALDLSRERWAKAQEAKASKVKEWWTKDWSAKELQSLGSMKELLAADGIPSKLKEFVAYAGMPDGGIADGDLAETGDMLGHRGGPMLGNDPQFPRGIRI